MCFLLCVSCEEEENRNG